MFRNLVNQFKQDRVSQIMLFGGLAVIFCIGCVLFAAIARRNQPQVVGQPTAPPVDTPLPTDPQERLLVLLLESLQKGNREIDRVKSVKVVSDTITIEWAINNSSWVRDIAKSDVFDILKVVSDSGVDYTHANLIGTFLLVDDFGNTAEKPVIAAVYSSSAIDRINWENFSSDNVDKIANSYFEHPALLKD